MSDAGGVWRTIGGRRVFIKDGQDLQSAMKESGKFEKKKKKSVVADNSVDQIEDYLYNETDRDSVSEEEIRDFVYNDVLDDELADMDATEEDFKEIFKRLEKDGYKVEKSEKAKIKTEDLEVGMPYDIKLSKDLDPKTGIYMGESEDMPGVRQFYDKSGIYGLSDKYIKEKGIDITDAENYDEVIDLIADIKKNDSSKKNSEVKSKTKKSNPSGLNSKEDYEHDLKFFEEMEKKYPSKGGLEANEDYQTLKTDYEKNFKTKWGKGTEEVRVKINNELNRIDKERTATWKEYNEKVRAVYADPKLSDNEKFEKAKKLEAEKNKKSDELTNKYMKKLEEKKKYGIE